MFRGDHPINRGSRTFTLLKCPWARHSCSAAAYLWPPCRTCVVGGQETTMWCSRCEVGKKKKWLRFTAIHWSHSFPYKTSAKPFFQSRNQKDPWFAKHKGPVLQEEAQDSICVSSGVDLIHCVMTEGCSDVHCKECITVNKVTLKQLSAPSQYKVVPRSVEEL